MQQPRLVKPSQDEVWRETHAIFHHHIVDSIKKIAVSELTLSLNNMFSHVDDYLFNLADKAESNQEQMRYFDTMREMRLRKDRIISNYFILFSKKYHARLTDKNNSDGGGANLMAEFDVLNFQLLDDEELEINVAVNNMKEHIRVDCREDLLALARRFEVILDHSYDVDTVPLSPDVLCHSFSEVINAIDVELQIKLIIFKIFDRYVLCFVEKLYKKVNELFIKKGVVPVIKYHVPVNPQLVRPLSSSNDGSILEGSHITGTLSIDYSSRNYHEDVFLSLQHLLHAKANNAKLAKDVNTSATSTRAVQPTFLSHDVLTGLTVMQEAASKLSNVECETLNNSITGKLIQRLQMVTGKNETRYLKESDTDIIDIVNLMFEFILADESLPHALRALIARLQIPIIKLAMLDSNFFSDKTHAARQLLNELAYSASIMRTREILIIEEDDAIYNKVKEIVDVILNKFTTNIEIFEEQLRILQNYIRDNQKGNKDENIRLENCKDKVVAELRKKLSTQNVPAVVELFIKDVWNDVLTSIGLRDNCVGTAWEAALRIVDDLIWSVQPKLLVQERSHLIKMIPRLLNRLQEGLCFINYGQPQIDQFFVHMESLHLNSLKGIRGDSAIQLVMALDQGQTSIDVEDIEDIEDIVLQSDQHDKYEYDLSDIKINGSPNFKIVANMEKGTWVEFSSGRRKLKGKLAWKCEFTGEYSFVDRSYTVVQHLNLRELVARFDKRQATIVEDIPLFDRAVDAVIVGLQQCSAKLVGAHPA